MTSRNEVRSLSIIIGSASSPKLELMTGVQSRHEAQDVVQTEYVRSEKNRRMHLRSTRMISSGQQYVVVD